MRRWLRSENGASSCHPSRPRLRSNPRRLRILLSLRSPRPVRRRRRKARRQRGRRARRRSPARRQTSRRRSHRSSRKLSQMKWPRLATLPGLGSQQRRCRARAARAARRSHSARRRSARAAARRGGGAGEASGWSSASRKRTRVRRVTARASAAWRAVGLGHSRRRARGFARRGT